MPWVVLKEVHRARQTYHPKRFSSIDKWLRQVLCIQGGKVSRMQGDEVNINN